MGEKRAKMTPHLYMSSKILMKLLLVLCLVSLIGLLFAHKDQIVDNLSPRWSVYYKSYLTKDNSGSEEIDEQLVTSTQFSTEPLQPKATTAAPSPKPSMAPNKPIKITPTLQKVSIKPIDELVESSHGPTQRPNVTLKLQNASTRKSTTFNYLGEKYATDETHVNSKCPNRTRDKLGSKEFQDMFLEKIPVLQWKKHAQESEYQRLKKYNGAQGWEGVTWQIIKESLNMLNSTGNVYMFDTWRGQKPCIRCAVVGNGGILNGSGMGQEIDSHDYVFRVNGAITKGFEKDVGERTSFFSFSTNTLMNSLNSYGNKGFKMVPRTPETRYVILPDHDRDYLMVRAALTNTIIDRGWDKGKDPSHYFGKNLTTEHFKILHPDFMRYLRNRFLNDPILRTTSRDIYRASTGASLLLAAIHTCDQVNAYGFMTPNYKKFSDHYFDSTYKPVIFYSNHNFRKEMILWQKLHNAGVIKLYMRD
ncbi:alpha-N-acetylgalactosaminide alpha-2,6-sialyltransferase 2-like [Bufo bufo]|uniref:alpha-N-acetylgalactosaminide alpha-2,6-sialyltransferase 2-like n=1 Tax=Bufo bufo TaxID=8384 RepID=UPI001ABDD0A3|nr:alpha-N-acetylgalactosaminide alpha-2,6-sialyltransferase 2-like [Bufo bufo]